MSIAGQRWNLTRAVTCDFPAECTARFEDTSGASATRLRGLARAAGWQCQNPGPGQPAVDFCPDHKTKRRHRPSTQPTGG